MTVLRRNGKLPQFYVSKLFSKLVFSIDFTAFFIQKYSLSHGIRILQLQRAINLVTSETSLSSAGGYSAWSGTGNYHTFAFSA